MVCQGVNNGDSPSHVPSLVFLGFFFFLNMHGCKRVCESAATLAEKNECQDYNNEMKERILQYCHNLNPLKFFND